MRGLAAAGFIVIGWAFLRLVFQLVYINGMPSDISEAPLFEALIVPHRSLSATGQRWLMLAMAGLCGLIALRFWFLGAWPIIAFCGLEGAAAVLLIYLNSRRARASELVMLTPNALLVVRTTPAGKRSEIKLASSWLNAVLAEPNGRVPRLLVGLRAQWIEIGSALGEAEKRELAAALQAALYRARNPVFGDAVRRPSVPSI